MQIVTFVISIPHFFSSIFLHFLQRHNHTSSIQSLTSRFKVHETFQTNYLNFNPAFVRVYRNHIVHTCR